MNRLKVRRAEVRMSQFSLRLKTGINQSKLSFFENDLIEPTKDEKVKLAEALGVNVEELFPDEVTAVGPGKGAGKTPS
jgi:transcriptional regulator with XRE-family HTH domain